MEPEEPEEPEYGYDFEDFKKFRNRRRRLREEEDENFRRVSALVKDGMRRYWRTPPNNLHADPQEYRRVYTSGELQNREALRQGRELEDLAEEEEAARADPENLDLEAGNDWEERATQEREDAEARNHELDENPHLMALEHEAEDLAYVKYLRQRKKELADPNRVPTTLDLAEEAEEEQDRKLALLGGGPWKHFGPPYLTKKQAKMVNEIGWDEAEEQKR